MARLIGPSEASREVKTIVTSAGATKGLFKSKALRPATYYTTSAANSLADVRDLDGNPIADSTVTIDAYSMLPLMQFPDGVDVVYVRVDGGPAWPVYAREDDQLDALETAVATLQGGVAGAETPSGAQAKANAAQAAAISAAATDATTKSSAAQAAAISAASTDATSKASAAQSAAISVAASDATSKASGAQAAAISAASTDATSKAAAAQAAAIAASAQRASNLSDLGSASTARTNLGLGASATRSVGTTSADVAAGDAPAAAQAAAISAAASDATSKVAAEATARTNADALLTPLARSIATIAPLVGGGNLSADRTLSVSSATSGAVGVIQLAGDLGGTATAPTVPALTGKVGKGDQVFNLKDYLGVGDGSTVNDTPFSNAIAAARNAGIVSRPNADDYIAHDHRGAVVLVPSGTYVINTPIVLPRSGDYRANTVGLVGQDEASTRIVAGSSFPAGRALIEWQDSATAGTNKRVRNQKISNLTLVPRNLAGCMAIWFQLLNSRSSYGTDVNSIDTMYDCTLQNLIVFGHNDYHQSLIRVEGRMDESLIDNITADLTLGTTYSTRLLHFDDFSLWPDLGTTAATRGLDYPGFNFGEIRNIKYGFRGGRGAMFWGRTGMGSRMSAMHGGLGSLNQEPMIYFRDSAALTFDDVIGEGYKENGIITFENCNNIEGTNFVLGRTDEATLAEPGSAFRFINSSRITLTNKWTANGIPAYSANNSVLVRIDAASSDLTFENFVGAASFELEWAIDPSATGIRVNYLNAVTGIRTRLPASTARRWPAGRWVSPRGEAVVSAASPASGSMYLFPVFFADPMIIDGLAWEITTQGVSASGSTDDLRVGLYADNGRGLPTGAALFDSGLQSLLAAAAVITAAVSWRIPKSDWYWMGVVRQVTGTPTTNAALRSATATGGQGLFTSDGTSPPTIGTLGGPGNRLLLQTGVTGALPSIGSLSPSGGASPIVLVKTT